MMNHVCKKVFVPLVLCCAIGTPAQPAKCSLTEKEVTERAGSYFTGNKMLLAAKCLDSFARAGNLIATTRTSESMIKNLALVNIATNILVAATKMYFKKSSGQSNRLPELTLVPNVVDLILSTYIIVNAETISKNNQEVKKLDKSGLYTILGLLATELGLHAKLHHGRLGATKEVAENYFREKNTVYEKGEAVPRVPMLDDSGGMAFGCATLGLVRQFVEWLYLRSLINKQEAEEDSDGPKEL